jgi:predicted signal transduction protein with EAL and GGDEF domain
MAIDDFGTGHSSMARLRAYAFDELKIDRSIVSDLGSGDATFVTARSPWPMHWERR